MPRKSTSKEPLDSLWTFWGQAFLVIAGLGALVLSLLPLQFEKQYFTVEQPNEASKVLVWVPSGQIESVSTRISTENWPRNLGEKLVFRGFDATVEAYSTPSEKFVTLRFNDGRPQQETIVNPKAHSITLNFSPSSNEEIAPINKKPENFFPEIEYGDALEVELITLELNAPAKNSLAIRIAIWAGVVFFTALGISLIVRKNMGTSGQSPRTKSWSFAAPDWFVTAAVLIGATLQNAKHDDGWVLHRSLSFFRRGFFGNIYDTADAITPQGWFPEFVLGLLGTAGAPYVLLRLFSALLLITLWLAFRRFFASRGTLFESNRGRWITAALFASFANIYLIGFRPELFIVTCLFGLVIFSRQFFLTGNLGSYAFALAFALLAFVSHQSGLTALFPGIFLYVYATVLAVRTKTTRSLLTITVMLAVAGYSTLIVPGGLETLLQEGRKFTQTSHRPQFISGEVDRLLSFVTLAGDDRKLVVLAAVSCVIAGLLYARPATARPFTKIYRKSDWSALFLAGLIPLGLVFTATKWEWHYATLLVPVLVFIALMKSQVQPRKVGIEFALVSWLIAFGVTLVAPNIGPLFTDSANEYSLASTLGGTWAKMLALALIVLLAANFEAPYTGFRRVVITRSVPVATAVAVSILVIAPTVVHQFSNALANSGSWGLRSPASQSPTCGLYDKVTLVTSVEELSQFSDQPGSSQEGPFGLTAQRISGKTAVSIADAHNSLIGFWIMNDSENARTVSVHYRGEAREIVTQPAPFPTWQLISLPHASDLTLETEESILVTSLAELKVAPARERLTGKTMLKSPNWFGPNDCTENVVVSSNVVGQLDFFGNPYSMNPQPELYEISYDPDRGLNRGQQIFAPLYPFATVREVGSKSR